MKLLTAHHPLNTVIISLSLLLSGSKPLLNLGQGQRVISSNVVLLPVSAGDGSLSIVIAVGVHGQAPPHSAEVCAIAF